MNFKCLNLTLKKWITDFLPNNYKGQRLNFDLVDADKNKVMAKANTKLHQET